MTDIAPDLARRAALGVPDAAAARGAAPWRATGRPDGDAIVAPTAPVHQNQGVLMSRQVTRAAIGVLALLLAGCDDAVAPAAPAQLRDAKVVTQPVYVAEALPPLAGATESRALAINDVGQIVGYSYDALGAQRAVLWTGTRVVAPPVDLGTLGGGFATAEGISGSGYVAGTSTLATGEGHAFRWDPVGGMIDLGTLGGSSSYGYDAGELGEVVGSSFLADDATTHAFIWTPAAGMRDLGTLPGYIEAYAFGINVLGDVVGLGIDQMMTWHAVMWPAGGAMVDLGIVVGAYGAQALAISDNGMVAGQMDMLDYTSHAFTWSGGVLADVALPPVGAATGYLFMAAGGVTNKGNLAGVAMDPAMVQSCTYCPAVLNAKTGFQFLPLLAAGADGVAEGINTPGQVVGYELLGGASRALRWRGK